MPGADAGNAAYWERLESLYLTATRLPAAERSAFLDAECSDDGALRLELEELLACSPAAADFFTRFGDVVHAAISDPPLAAADALIGSQLGHYRIEDRIGAGGMGVVYRAHDTQLQRVVAVKLLSSPADEHARKRFLNEARVAAALDHPNICAIHEIGETASGVPYIAMAFCAGETLKAVIARGRLAVPDAANIALQVARGLAAAHACGIIHRDVKPANVMLVAEGLVKLVDFGLARLLDATVTRSGTMGGTFAYMAPELVRGRPADERTDLWSLGVVLYEMLTGSRPFRADSDAALLFTIAHERPEPIEEVLPDLPVALAGIVGRLLHDDAQARYESARAVIADLEQFATTSSQPSPRGVLQHTPRSYRRPLRRVKRWLLPAAGAAVLAAAAIIVTRDAAAPVPGKAALPRVAVLSFHDDTPEQNAAAIASALTGTLTDALARVPGLDVPSLNAMRPYRDRETSLSAVANELAAAWLVGGFVERTGDRVIITAELSDSTGRRLDSRRIERSVGAEQVLIDETVEAVAFMLRERVGEVMRGRRWQAGTNSPQALALLHQAMRHVADADSLVERSQPRAALVALQRADAALARAAAADDEWPDPLIERAWIARTLAFTMFGLGLGHDSVAATLERGIQQASAALRRQREAARAYEVRGVLRHAAAVLLEPDDGERRTTEAETDLTTAAESDSTLARALSVLSMIQLARGDFEEARLTTERAYRADYYFQAPDIVYRLFNTAFETQQDAQARKWCDQISRRFPQSWYIAYCELMLMTWSPAEQANVDRTWQLVARATAATPVAVKHMVAPQLEVLAAGVVARALPGDSAAHVLDRALARAAADQRLDPGSRLTLQLFEAGVRMRLGQQERARATVRDILRARPGDRSRLASSRILGSLLSGPRLRETATAE